MRAGVPKEVKYHEYRVAITSIGVHEMVAHGHEVFVQGAVVGSQIPNEEYAAAGAKIVGTPEEAWGIDGGIDMVLKVEEPVAEEYHRMRESRMKPGSVLVDIAIDQGWAQAGREDQSLALGLNTHAGQLTNAPVGDAVGIDAVSIDELLG